MSAQAAMRMDATVAHSRKQGDSAGGRDMPGTDELLDAVTTVRRIPVLPVRTPWLAPTTRLLAGLAGVLVLALAAFAGWRVMQDPTRFPVSNVDVLGTLDYTDRDALQREVSTFTDQGFYALDIAGLRTAVERLPWVARARIAREWPGRLEIAVEEHEPAARWNDDALVSKRLELFRPPQLEQDDVRYVEWQRLFSDLPALRGADGRHERVLDDYRRYERDLATVGLGITRLEEDDRRSQTLVLDGNVTLRLGYVAHELRMERFLDVYAQLDDELGKAPVRFDMRYSNGFALAGGRSKRS